MKIPLFVLTTLLIGLVQIHYIRAETTATSQIPIVEGGLYIDRDTGMVFLNLYGSFRHVPNEPTFWSLFNVPLDDGSHLIQLRNSDLPNLPLGTPLVDGAQLLQDTLTNYRYLLDVEDGVFKRRLISNDGQFAKYKFNSAKLVRISHATCLAIPQGRPI